MNKTDFLDIINEKITHPKFKIVIANSLKIVYIYTY